MSKLLSAIAQSESQNSGVAGASSSLFAELMTDPRAAAKRGAQRYRTALLVMLPVVGLVGYSMYSGASSETTPSTVSASVAAMSDDTPPVYKEASATPVVEVIQDEPYFPAGIERLSYPDLYTEPLPRHPADPDVIAATHQPLGGDNLGMNETPQFVPPTKPATQTWDLDALDYTDISPELAAQLRSAIAATEEGDAPMPELLENERAGIPIGGKVDYQAIDLADMPMAMKNRIPKLDFQTHIYSSSPDSRWVKVNGEEAYEGDEIAPGVVLKQISPRNVAFTFEKFLISMPALSSW
ncbi:general secretion pathway protein GspB [Photobacterium japonica]|uniref:general secretion pathway protein GspB n=1 Tax=Photobacterium japonica TaxID=2910235 RepID=UPI003D0AC9CD